MIFKYTEAFYIVSLTILYKKRKPLCLVGIVFGRFRIEPQTGWVTVGPCPTQPGRPECLDYETQRRYDLTATATDENGADTGRTNTAPLTIHIRDENDNSPGFLLPSYTEYIREGDLITVNPLIVEVSLPWL